MDRYVIGSVALLLGMGASFVGFFAWIFLGRSAALEWTGAGVILVVLGLFLVNAPF